MMVKLSDPEHELYLLQPHTDHKTLELTHNMLEELDTRDDLELVMPGSVVHSSLSLSPHLTSLGHHTLNIPVYHQSSLHFIPKEPPHTRVASRRLVLRNFYIIIKQQNSVILMGRFSQ